MAPPAREAVRVSIRRSPGGVITESHRVNLTLHCHLEDAGGGPVDGVAWYYQGELLTHLPHSDCHQGSGGGPELSHVTDVTEFSGQHLLLSEGEFNGDLIEEEFSGSGDYTDLELSGSGQYGEPGVRLCGVDPTQLVLHEVGREFSGHYSCAILTGGSLGPTSDLLHLSVQCKILFIFYFLTRRDSCHG